MSETVNAILVYVNNEKTIHTSLDVIHKSIFNKLTLSTKLSTQISTDVSKTETASIRLFHTLIKVTQVEILLTLLYYFTLNQVVHWVTYNMGPQILEHCITKKCLSHR